MQSQNNNTTRIISEQTVVEKKWLGIKHINYCIGERTISNYEGVFRPQRKQKGTAIDGVEIVPIIKRKDGTSELVLIANFRPSVGYFCIQFPAGLLQSQDYELNALRQLEEETGYVAQKILKLPAVPIHCDPWKSNEAGFFYVGIINGDNPNHRKSQDLDHDENIRIETLPIDDKLLQNLDKLINEKGYLIHTKVWTFCLGFNLTKFVQF